MEITDEEYLLLAGTYQVYSPCFLNTGNLERERERERERESTMIFRMRHESETNLSQVWVTRADDGLPEVRSAVSGG